ncbi:MAG: hypothetical protein WCK25_03815 [Actinomycetes bacterium]
MAEKPQRKGIPASVALPVLITGAVFCFLIAFSEVVENVIKYLNCNLDSGDTYCHDGTWSAGDSFTIALLLSAAGILMIILSRTFKNPKTQAVQLSSSAASVEAAELCPTQVDILTLGEKLM